MIVRQVRVVLSPDKPHYPDKLRYVTMLPNDWQLRICHIMRGLCVTAQTKNVTSPVVTEYRPCYHPGYVNIMSVLCPRLPSSSVCVHHSLVKSFCTILARRSLNKMSFCKIYFEVFVLWLSFFNWSLFLKAHLTSSQHWFRQNHNANRWWYSPQQYMPEWAWMN